MNKLLRRLLWEGILRKQLWRKNKFIVALNNEERRNVISKIRMLNTINKKGVNDLELYNLYTLARAAQKYDGSMAEVGTWNGCSSRIIASARDSNRKFILFDTFEGIPEVDDIDKATFSKGDFSASLESVQDYLRGCNGIEFCKGIFPESAAKYVNYKFCFVHLDVDTEKSTRESLEFFYPKMTRGGIIVSHDYQIVEGVTKAFREFYLDKVESIIEISTTQCAVIKM